MKKNDGYGKVSIIIPVYNNEKYIERCLKSIVSQTYDNIEIIIINDGSVDKSDSIIKQYSIVDSRIVYIVQENKGVSQARNIGIDRSSGEYITFVDSDDTIQCEAIQVLVEKLQENDLDVCVGLLKYIDKEKEFNINRKLDESEVTTGIECINKMLYTKNIRFHAVAKLYKRELFNKVRFPTGRVYEDTGCVYKIIYKAMKVGYIDRKIYNYYTNKLSISRSEFNSTKFDLIVFTNEIKAFLIKNNSYDKCKKNYLNFEVDSYLSLYKDIKKSSNKDWKENIGVLNKLANINNWKVMRSVGVTVKNKFKYLLKNIIY